MKNREEGDCPTYSLFLCKGTTLLQEQLFSMFQTLWRTFPHQQKYDKYCPIKSTSKTKAPT